LLVGGVYSPLRRGKTPTAWRFTPQTWRSRAIARETLLKKLRFRYFPAGFGGFSGKKWL
jgi:hypothetical protein